MAEKDADKNVKAPAKANPRAIFIAVLVVVVVAVMAFLVYRNNQASKATHEELKATQTEFSAVETSFKESSQKLENAVGECEKSYKAYNLCSDLAQAHKEVEADYFATKKEIEAINSENEETMDEVITHLKSAISTVQDLDRKAKDIVSAYQGSLLKATQEEHSKLIEETDVNLKEAKALLAASQGKTSDQELWAVFARMLDVHEKELNKQKGVAGDSPDAYIESSTVLRTENAAIISVMSHLKEIYDSANVG